MGHWIAIQSPIWAARSQNVDSLVCQHELSNQDDPTLEPQSPWSALSFVDWMAITLSVFFLSMTRDIKTLSVFSLNDVPHATFALVWHALFKCCMLYATFALMQRVTLLTRLQCSRARYAIQCTGTPYFNSIIFILPNFFFIVMK